MDSGKEDIYDDNFYDDDDDDDDEDDIPVARKHNRLKECLNWVTFRWIKSPTGFLKIFQFGTLLMGLIVIGSVTTGERISKEFFVFVSTSAWMFVLIIVILNILDVFQKMPKVLTNNLMLFVGCAIGSLMLMLSSAIMMACHKNNKSVQTAGAFGLIAMGLTILEMVYFLTQWRKYGVYTQQQILNDGTN